MNTQKTVTAANAAQSIDGVLWMHMYTATEGAGRVQGIRGHFGGPACFAAAYLPGADHDPASPTRTAPAGIRPSTAQHPTPCGTDRLFPFAQEMEEGTMAKTTQNGNGGRLIVMQDSGNNLNNAVTLQHEAHRDGIVGANNKQETYRATLAHTRMAAALYNKGLTMTENLARDLMVYKMSQEKGSGFFREYTDQTYDSTADYWKINKDGSITWDGHLNFYNETGNDTDPDQGKVLDYRELANVLNNIDPGQTKVLLGETEVEVSRLREIFGHNEKMIKSGTNLLGFHTSKAAKFLLEDGFMSYDDAKASYAEVVSRKMMGPTYIEHMSTRYVLNGNNEFSAYFQDVINREAWTADRLRRETEDPKTPAATMTMPGSTVVYTLYTAFKSSLHGPDNFKYVDLEGGRELVFDKDRDFETDPRFLGTFNFSNETMKHARWDVAPWIKWGNTPDDPTNRFTRSGMLLFDSPKNYFKPHFNSIRSFSESIDWRQMRIQDYFNYYNYNNYLGR